MSEAPGYQRFFAELKRRKVFQVAAVYGAAMFGVLQAADVLVPALHLPEGLITGVAVIGLIGFPIALVVAWTYERTAAGLVRTGEAAPGELTQIITAPAAKRWPVGLAAAAGTALLLVGGWLALGRPASGEGDAATPAEAGTATSASTVSIAVLPFEDMSELGDKEYFSDGLSEELIDVLVRVEGLRVAARTSSFAFKESAADIRTIADSLDVETVLEGSVRASGDRLKITAQLIQASDGFHLWSDTYERELTDVFEVQEEIATAISEALLGTLELEGRTEFSVTRTDIEAYEQYLLGRAFVSQRGPALRRAEDHFRAAIAIDSTYAPAWGGLAEVFAVYPYYVDVPIDEALAESERAARRALALDSLSASARVALGSVLRERRQWAEAEAELRKALELSPENAEANGEYAQYLAYVGRLEEASSYADRALALDPLSGHKLGIAGVYSLLAGDDETAEERMWRVRDFSISANILTQHLVSQGRLDEAERAARLSPNVAEMLTRLVEAVRSPAGSEVRARAIEQISDRKMQLDLGGGTPQPAWLLLLGEREEAVDLLEAFLEEQVLGLEVLWLPVYDPIRDHPRYPSIVAGLELPE
jgi:TolB-like protein/Tfp pilus assembly protein PilF